MFFSTLFSTLRAAAFLVCLSLALSSSATADVETGRNPEWAEPLASVEVPNLFRVTPDIYRSAQPDATDMKRLERMGIRTVINLRARHSDADTLDGTQIVPVSIPINTWDIDDDKVVRALRALRDAKKPVLVHCQHGADRTGLIIAAYRMTAQNWSREKALDELQNGGYGFHSIWRNIPEYIRKMDVERIRAQVAAPLPQKPEESVK